MITAESFREQWGRDGDPPLPFPGGATDDVAIPESAKAFLNNAGLPEAAAPFLDFSDRGDGPLPRASEAWGIGPAFTAHRVIGSNDCGDPICLDERAQGRVVYLNHDNGFQAVFVNSSVQQLASALLAYRQLVRDTQARNGPDAWLDSNVPADLVERLRDELQRIDPPALGDSAFWESQLVNLAGR